MRAGEAGGMRQGKAPRMRAPGRGGGAGGAAGRDDLWLRQGGRRRVGDLEITIGPMEPRDIEQVVQIERAVYPSPWSPQAFYAEITENLCACYITARAGPAVVGYAGMWVLLGEAHVTNVAVHPAYQRCGIGSRLLEELIERARLRGATRMTLEVRPSNAVALHLYEKYGFRQKGVRRNYYSDTQEDAIIMWLEDLRAERL
ncbi:MAG: ribosomal protein S18-alanine N-acetyltransferase [Acetobacteraceae bacterium]|nr:ribosomal protein S18-alanine N-acetyltransferase [Acetobacteraceae bacterium]